MFIRPKMNSSFWKGNTYTIQKDVPHEIFPERIIFNPSKDERWIAVGKHDGNKMFIDVVFLVY